MIRCIVGTVTSAAVALAAPRAASADIGCGRIVVSPALPPSWADAVRDLTAQLAALPPTECRPATLAVEAVDGEVRLVAVADDGRRAERRVSRPSMLVPTALGLVILGPPEADAAPGPAPSPPAEAKAPETPDTQAAPAPGPASPGPSAASIAPAPRAVTVWLGLTAGARIGVPSTISMADVEGRADLRVEHLLLFVAFRDVPMGIVASQGWDTDAYRESSIGFGVGRSVPIGRYLLDVAIAPALVTMRLSKDGPTHLRADDVELRIGAVARLNIPLSPNWRLTLAADTDIIPDFLKSEDRIGTLPAFPSWTSGVSVGIAGALL